MPLDFLTQAERQRYQSQPAAIAERDLRQHFHLSEADRAFVATFRGATSRLGVALHLGLLRYLGYLPDDWAVHMPIELRAFVAGQLADGAYNAERRHSAIAYRSPNHFETPSSIHVRKVSGLAGPSQVATHLTQ